MRAGACGIALLVASGALAVVGGTVHADAERHLPEPRLPEIPSEYLIHEGEGILVAYHPGTRERVRALLPRLSEVRRELSESLGHPVLDQFEIRVGAMPIDLRRLLPSGSTELDRAVFDDRVLVLHAERDQSSSDLERSIRLELSRIALRQAQGESPDWFVDGFAQQYAQGALSRSLRTIRETTLERRSPEFSILSGPSSDKGRVMASDFVRFMGTDRLGEMTRLRKQGETFESSLRLAFGAPSEDIAKAWKADVAVRHTLLPLLMLGLVLWGAIAALVRLRRKAPLEAETTDRTRKRRLRMPVGVVARNTPRQREPAVPRVEHEGRWHTLH